MSINDHSWLFVQKVSGFFTFLAQKSFIIQHKFAVICDNLQKFAEFCKKSHFLKLGLFAIFLQHRLNCLQLWAIPVQTCPFWPVANHYRHRETTWDICTNFGIQMSWYAYTQHFYLFPAVLLGDPLIQTSPTRSLSQSFWPFANNNHASMTSGQGNILQHANLSSTSHLFSNFTDYIRNKTGEEWGWLCWWLWCWTEGRA